MVLRSIMAGAAMLLAAECFTVSAKAQETAGGVEGCAFINSTSDQMDAVLRDKGAVIDGYGAFCTQLNAANMGVDVAEFARPQFDETAAVVTLRLYDLATGVRGPESSSALTVVTGTDAVANVEALSNAFDRALQDMADQLDTFTASVRNEKARLAALYSEPAAPLVRDTAEPCRLLYVGSANMNEAIDRWGGFPQFDGYDALCRALRARGAGLGFAGGGAMNGTTSQAWASVSVYDAATQTLGAATAFGIAATQNAQEAQVDDNLFQALGGALAGVAREQEAVLATLDLVLAGDRRTFAAESP
ncbi:hypothetical protein [Alteraurantiacibacter buctensis]|uniref:Uncharacterized protein n=1 Tax=Alteraurantiacibacter buctensis TaxID=1503981 RepID=A0A844YW80_9SPHN|nr:hypothetical protein [Alteraurantiacibacter buctensis]MXO71208.1 hypothetical protein [Alteraurantiacibacter buctensis]